MLIETAGLQPTESKWSYLQKSIDYQYCFLWVLRSYFCYSGPF